jgi:hypothetical protein
MRELLNGSTLKITMAAMMDRMSIRMASDLANTTCLTILGRDPNIRWEIRERMDLSIIIPVLHIIILWTVWHMKMRLAGNSLKARVEPSLTKIKLMLLKEVGMIPKTIGILIFTTVLVIWKDLIKFQRIKSHSLLLASIINQVQLVKKLQNTL